jgi:hypothetical protein
MWLSWQLGLILAGVFAVLGLAAPRDRAQWLRVTGALLREAAIVMVLYSVWGIAGEVAVTEPTGAVARAHWVWNVERALHLPNESWLQAGIITHSLLVQAANIYYAIVHVPAMAACLVWLFVAHRDRYSRWRNAIAFLTGACLLVQLIAVAPPRFIPSFHVVDTAVQYHQSVYAALGRGDVGQLQAMPSLHVGWAMIVALSMWQLAASAWRFLGVGHLAITMYVVVVTGNHYWLDGLIGIAILVIILAGQHVVAARWPGRLPQRVERPSPALEHDLPVGVLE